MNKDRQLDDFFGFDSEKEKNESGKWKGNSIKDTLLKKISNKSKIKFIPKLLSKKERYLIFALLLVALASIISIPLTSYIHFTREAPDHGGIFIEGIVGEPRHINPLLSQTNDVDRDLVKLIYSGLLKYNNEGKIVPDLAKSYDISSDGLNYTIYLKENIMWHDDEPFTVEDIIYTINTAQNSDYGSSQVINWRGVEVKKIDETTLIFTLKNKYAQFLNNLTLSILPKHLWQNVKPINFALSELNLKPIGTGPYTFERLQKDKSGKIRFYELSSNKDFYNSRPFISKVQLKFYNSEDEMINAYNRNEIESLSYISPKNLEKIKFKQRINLHNIKIPKYFGIFFNQNQSNILSDKNIRLSLSHATDKRALLINVIKNSGLVINSPLLGEILDINKDVKKYIYDTQLAKDILDAAGWDEVNEDGIRVKNGNTLSIKLTTSTWPELTEIAVNLKEQWLKVGIETNVEILPNPELQQAIKDRQYEMFLFGEILSLDPDPFILWHSSQKKDPGLNLALYDNKTADTFLEEARQSLNPLERAEKYDNFQRLVIEDIPAIFLYSPSYIYGQTRTIKGFNNTIISIPSDRFIDVETWFIDTKRSWR